MFQKTKKHIYLFALLGMATVLLSGCSFFNRNNQEEKSISGKKESRETSIVATPDLPEATGKVSDTISALDVAVTSENSIVSGDESSAKNVVVDDQETSDFNQVYNENDF